MDEVDVSDDSRHKNLKRTHANSTNDTAGQERAIAVRKVGPYGGYEQKQISEDHDRTAAEFD